MNRKLKRVLLLVVYVYLSFHDLSLLEKVCKIDVFRTQTKLTNSFQTKLSLFGHLDEVYLLQ